MSFCFVKEKGLENRGTELMSQRKVLSEVGVGESKLALFPPCNFHHYTTSFTVACYKQRRATIQISLYCPVLPVARDSGSSSSTTVGVSNRSIRRRNNFTLLRKSKISSARQGHDILLRDAKDPKNAKRPANAAIMLRLAHVTTWLHHDLPPIHAVVGQHHGQETWGDVST